MTKQILKPVLIGVLVGTALFVLPFFVLRTLVLLLIIGGLFRLIVGRWSGWRGYRGNGGFHPALADTIRSMSEEEYQAFRQKFQTYSDRYPSETPKRENK